MRKLEILQKLGLWKTDEEIKEANVGALLADRNRKDECESLCSFSTHGHCKHKKNLKSGMLDKVTANIERREVWFQKNLRGFS